MVLVHGLDTRGEAGGRGGRRNRQASRTRARRQVGQRGPRRRRPADGGGYGVANCYLNSGQTCSAHTRMLVPREKLAEAEAVAQAAAEEGDARRSVQDGMWLGDSGPPPCSAAVLVHPETGREEGARAFYRGARSRPIASTTATSAAYGLLRGDARHDDRPGGDLRPGALDHSLRLRGRGGGDRQLDHLRAGRRRLVGATPSGRRRSRGGCAPARCRSTERPSIRWRPFGGYKQSGRGREYGQASASRSSSRSSPFRSDAGELNYRARTAQARATAVRRRIPRSPIAVVKLPI